MNMTINNRGTRVLSAVSPPAVLRRAGLAADPQIAAVISLLGLRPGEHVLDGGCGTGARAIELGYYGCRVTAIDPVGWRIAAARSRSAQGCAQVSFYKRDPREFVLLDTLDAAIVSLDGEDRLDDRRILANIAASLRPCGRLLVDAGNYISTSALVMTLLRAGFPRVEALTPTAALSARNHILAIARK